MQTIRFSSDNLSLLKLVQSHTDNHTTHEISFSKLRKIFNFPLIFVAIENKNSFECEYCVK